MRIFDHEIQIWTAELTLTPEEEENRLALLSEDEVARANRFHFPVHKRRFIAAHSLLRILLARYLGIPPAEIAFTLSEHKKPYLSDNHPQRLQFNISHSGEMAAFAFTLQHALGIDIEKIQDKDHSDLARRFFSEEENQALASLSPQDRLIGFYRLWAHKEALIKATGKGLSISLASFTVSLGQDVQTIMLAGEAWRLVSLSLHPDFQAAAACHPSIKQVSCWKYFDQTPILDKVYEV